LAKNDRAGAETYLSLEGGHGLLDENTCWMVDSATHPWQEGSTLAEMTYTTVEADVLDDQQVPGFLGWSITFGGDKWEVLECSFETIHELKNFMLTSAKATNSHVKNYYSNKSRL
jgi:hypothetical protein